jgi:hypothetical protein
MSFKKIIIIAILVAPFVFAYKTKPTLDDHKTKIYQLAGSTEDPLKGEQLALPEWDGVEFVDWVFITGTRNKEKQSLISFGLCKYVKVVDTDWGPKALGFKKEEEKK